LSGLVERHDGRWRIVRARATKAVPASRLV
jgi:hypothetical protein